MAVRSLVQLELEAERPDAPGELLRSPAALHDPERPPVGQRSRLLPVRLVGPVWAVSPAPLSTRKTRPPGCERGAHEPPELVEPLLRHVREPEGEEDEVEPLGRPPLEDVGTDELGSVGVERERLGIRVDGDDALRQPDELARPDPRPGRELEHGAPRRELLERRIGLGDVRLPARERVRLELVPAAAVPPVVVLRRPLRVIALLLREKVAHAAASSTRSPSTPASESA